MIRAEGRVTTNRFTAQKKLQTLIVVAVAVLSVRHRNHGGSVWLRGKNGQQIMEHPENGFIREQIKGIQMYILVYIAALLQPALNLQIMRR